MARLMYSAAELPGFEVSTETVTLRGLPGTTGIGEPGTIDSMPALHNTVCDAAARLGIDHVDMPCNPQNVSRGVLGVGAAQGPRVVIGTTATPSGRS